MMTIWMFNNYLWYSHFGIADIYLTKGGKTLGFNMCV
jgi:hypothetical protein